MRVYLDALSRVPTVSIGTQALIIGSMEIILNKYSDAKFIMLSAFPEIEEMYCAGYNVDIQKRSDGQFGTILQIRNILEKVDAVVSPWGDGYITVPPHKIFQKTMFLKKKGVPLVLFTSSVGPFKGFFKTILAKLGLQRFDSLTVRDTITFDYLRKLKLNNVKLYPDTAFCMSAADDDRVDAILNAEGVNIKSGYIGLNVSVLMYYRFKDWHNKDYKLFMIDLIEKLRNKYKKSVLLIPHQIYPSIHACSEEKKQSLDGDDRYPIKLILDGLKDKANIYALNGEYTPREYKGLIKRSEIFIGGRMHSVIGAISTGVPSVIMQYSHKAGGVMKMLGLEKYVWDISDNIDELMIVIDKLWCSREELSAKLQQDMVKIKADTLAVGDELRNAIEKK